MKIINKIKQIKYIFLMIPTIISSKVEKAIKNYLILNEVLGSGA